MVIKFPTLFKFHSKKDIRGICEAILQVHNKWIINFFHNVSFECHVFTVTKLDSLGIPNNEANTCFRTEKVPEVNGLGRFESRISGVCCAA